MAYSTQRAVSDGTLVLLDLSLDYFDRSELSVLIGGIVSPVGTGRWAWVGTTNKQLSFTPAVPSGVEVTVQRATQLATPLHQYTAGAQFIAETLDENFKQVLHIAQEARETAGGADATFLQAGAGAAPRTIETELRERVSVMQFGAKGNGVTDDSRAFQAAIDVLPAGGGKITVPPGVYRIDVQPNWGTKSVQWDFSTSATFTGTGTGQNKFPSMRTNGGQIAAGPWIQSQSRIPYTYSSPFAGGVAALQVEMLQPADVVGQSVALYLGASGSNPNPNANVWALNPLIRAEAGAGGTYQGIEMDVDVFSDAALVKGISLNGIGTADADVGLELLRSDSTRWATGIDVMNARTGIKVRNTPDLTMGVTVGGPAAQASAAIAAKQLANGGDGLVLQRATDTSPTGYVIRYVNAANNDNLLLLDAQANLTTKGSFTQPTTDQRFSESGARINRLNDRLFVGKSATQYDGKGTPTAKSWVGTPSGGIYEYLESNATFAAYAEGSGLGMFSAARSSATAGTGAEVSIGAAAFAYHDRANATSGVWSFYATALRENANINGSTIGMEIDVANMGATVPLFPALPFQPGLTLGLSVAAGGETTNNFHAGISSAGITVTSNDAGAHLPVAQWDKGIVFHNKALAGCDGATGYGVALAFAKGHQQLWYNNSNQVVAEVVTTNPLATAATRLDFTQYGLVVKDRVTDGAQFQVESVPGSVNYLTARGSVAGAKAAELCANGTDANIDLVLTAKGTGTVRTVAMVATASNDTGVSTLAVQNDSTAAVTTKYAGLDFRGKDTVNALKVAASVRSSPVDSNLVAAGLSFFIRSGDVLSEQARLSSAGNLLVGTTTDSGGSRLQVNGHVAAKTLGAGFRVTEGANAKQGVATLVGGVVTVSNANVTNNSRIFLTSQIDGGTPGFLRVSSRVAGTSFTITSSSATDTSFVAYEIFEPA